eukprot:IDg4739t1
MSKKARAGFRGGAGRERKDRKELALIREEAVKADLEKHRVMMEVRKDLCQGRGTIAAKDPGSRLCAKSYAPPPLRSTLRWILRALTTAVEVGFQGGRSATEVFRHLVSVET